MAEVDWAEWAIEAADGFRETKWQNIGVALRQLAHELIDTRARLTTAETERDQAMWDKRRTGVRIDRFDPCPVHAACPPPEEEK